MIEKPCSRASRRRTAGDDHASPSGTASQVPCLLHGGRRLCRGRRTRRRLPQEPETSTSSWERQSWGRRPARRQPSWPGGCGEGEQKGQPAADDDGAAPGARRGQTDLDLGSERRSVGLVALLDVAGELLAGSGPGERERANVQRKGEGQNGQPTSVARARCPARRARRDGRTTHFSFSFFARAFSRWFPRAMMPFLKLKERGEGERELVVGWEAGSAGRSARAALYRSGREAARQQCR